MCICSGTEIQASIFQILCFSRQHQKRILAFPYDGLLSCLILPLPFHVPSFVIQHTANAHLLKLSELERTGSMSQLCDWFTGWPMLSLGCCHALKTDTILPCMRRLFWVHHFYNSDKHVFKKDARPSLTRNLSLIWELTLWGIKPNARTILSWKCL